MTVVAGDKPSRDSHCLPGTAGVPALITQRKHLQGVYGFRDSLVIHDAFSVARMSSQAFTKSGQSGSEKSFQGSDLTPVRSSSRAFVAR
jgi:hypothetical protein